MEKDGIKVNGKSIIGIMMLAAAKNSKITITTAGSDAPEAMEELGQLIKDGFGED